MKRMVIFGIGNFAELAYYYFSKSINYEVVAFTAHRSFVNSETFLGLPLVPFEEVEQIYSQELHHMFVAVGYTQINNVRKNVYLQAKNKGYHFASFISDDAIVASNVKLGDNNIILEGAIVQPFVKLGNAVILWSGCHIGHHSIIRDYCFVAPGASLAGNVTISEESFIGNSAVIRDGIRIGKQCIIGAGVVILEDTLEKAVYKSNPSTLLGITSDQLRSI